MIIIIIIIHFICGSTHVTQLPEFWQNYISSLVCNDHHSCEKQSSWNTRAAVTPTRCERTQSRAEQAQNPNLRKYIIIINLTAVNLEVVKEPDVAQKKGAANFPAVVIHARPGPGAASVPSAARRPTGDRTRDVIWRREGGVAPGSPLGSRWWYRPPYSRYKFITGRVKVFLTCIISLVLVAWDPDEFLEPI